MSTLIGDRLIIIIDPTGGAEKAEIFSIMQMVIPST